jgi:hypothetical protein
MRVFPCNQGAGTSSDGKAIENAKLDLVRGLLDVLILSLSSGALCTVTPSPASSGYRATMLSLWKKARDIPRYGVDKDAHNETAAEGRSCFAHTF